MKLVDYTLLGTIYGLALFLIFSFININLSLAFFTASIIFGFIYGLVFKTITYNKRKEGLK